MSNLETALPPRLHRRLDRWLHRWGTPSLASTLRVEFSPRMSRAFGRCYQEQRLIRLAASLGESQSYLLDEILCHEAAHAAVYETYGDLARPHGEEWEELMRMAGFEPRIRIPVAVRRPSRSAGDRPVVYLHRCPVCDGSRRAARPMQQWRCRACLGTRSRGRLEIRRATSRAATKAASKSRRNGSSGGGQGAGKASASPRRRKTAAKSRAKR
jgi:predicted SprT family Zn-dependent metalloprotease